MMVKNRCARYAVNMYIEEYWNIRFCYVSASSRRTAGSSSGNSPLEHTIMLAYYVITYFGPSPPCGVCQLISQVLQCMQLIQCQSKDQGQEQQAFLQSDRPLELILKKRRAGIGRGNRTTYFCALIWNLFPNFALSSSTYSYTPAGQNRFSKP